MSGYDTDSVTKLLTKRSGPIQINVVAAAKTFTRLTGSFVADGFEAGDLVTTAGFTNGGNNGAKQVFTVAATVLTMTVATGLVDETGNGNETVVGPDSTGIYVAGVLRDRIYSVADSIYSVTLSADTHNWLIPQATRIIMINASVPVNITGIAGGTHGRQIVVVNRGVASTSITLKHFSGSSSAANQILGPGGADIGVSVWHSVGLVYGTNIYDGAGYWVVTN